MNIRAMLTDNKDALNTVYNVAFGERTDLNELVNILKEELSQFDEKIAQVEVKYGPKRAGDVPHSLASIDRARERVGYNPEFSIKDGLKEAMAWYWKNLK
jgi:UDP-N-acetylglucosamine 4-epimerase